MRMAALCVLFVMPVVARAQELRPAGPRAPYVLRETGTFGATEYVPRSNADSLTRRSGGDMFGRVTEFTPSADGSGLYVLDNVGRKLVFVGLSGDVRVLFAWRNGKGPGEFTRARGMAVTPNGILIGDMSDYRLSFFDLNGKFQRTVPLNANLLQVIPVANGFAVSNLVIRDGAHQVLMLNADGTVQDSLVPMRGRLADFTAFGEPGTLFRDGRGQPWLASPAAGMVCTVARNSMCSGVDLFPAVKGSIDPKTGGRTVGLGVRGAAQLSTGETLILAKTYRGPSRMWLFVFDREMKYKGYIDAGPDQMLRISRGFRGNEILVSMDDPYPRVVRYVVERR
jgi:hypothetical protein